MRRIIQIQTVLIITYLLLILPLSVNAQEAGAEVIPDTDQTSEAGLQSLNPVSGGETSGQNPLVTSGEGPIYPTVIDKTLDSRVAVTNKDGKTVMTCEGVRNKGICDPTLQDVTLLGLSIARFLVGLAGGVVILMLCYGGFNYISGYMQGSEGGAETGKTIITNAIIGLILVLTSYLIVTMFQSTLTSKTFVEETQNGGTEGVVTSITTDRTSSNNYLNNTQVSSTTNVNASASQTGSGISVKQNGTRAGIIAYVKAKYGTNGKPAENGNIDKKKLKNFKDNETYSGGGYLIPEAADQWIAFVKYMNTQGKKITIGSTYRDLAGQRAVQGGGMAAPLGTSMHGWGVAFDVHEFYRPGHYKQLAYKNAVKVVYDSPDYKWFTENIAKYGFYNPEGLRNDWERPEWYKDGVGGLDEPWHFEYYGGGIGKTLLATIDKGDCKNIATTVNLGNSIKAQLNENPSCSLEDRDGILAMEEAMNNYNAEQENLDAESEVEDLEMEGSSVSVTTEDPFLNSVEEYDYKNAGEFAAYEDQKFCDLASRDFVWNKILKADITGSCKKPEIEIYSGGDVSEPSLTPEVKAMLDVIAFEETKNKGQNGYDILYGGSKFNDFTKHPNKEICEKVKKRDKKGNYLKDKKGNIIWGKLCSTAAGRYQFLSPTWKDLVRDHKFVGFGIKTQDLAAVELLRWRGVYDFVKKGQIEKALDAKNPKKFDTKDKKYSKYAALGTEWASFPGGPWGQQKRGDKLVRQEIIENYNKRLSYYRSKK